MIAVSPMRSRRIVSNKMAQPAHASRQCLADRSQYQVVPCDCHQCRASSVCAVEALCTRGWTSSTFCIAASGRRFSCIIRQPAMALESAKLWQGQVADTPTSVAATLSALWSKKANDKLGKRQEALSDPGLANCRTKRLLRKDNMPANSCRSSKSWRCAFVRSRLQRLWSELARASKTLS